MTEPVLELTEKGHDQVVAVACGKCRRVCHNRILAEQCCLPLICSACGERCDETGWTMCKSCRGKKRAAQDQKRYDDAKKVPIAEYDHDHVCRGPHGGEDEYVLVDEWDSFEEGRNWAWACNPLPWPKLDATDVIYSMLEDNFPEYADESLDGEALQKLLDEWVEKQTPSNCYMADHTRIVVFPEAVDEPDFASEEMMNTEELGVEKASP